MKKIFNVLFLMVTALIMTVTAKGQTPELTAEYLGLPQEVFESAKTTVFTSSSNLFFEIIPVTSTTVKKGVTTKTTSYSMRLKKQNGSSTAYGLNLVYMYAHDYGCAYTGQNDTAFVFSNDRQSAYLTTSGNVHRFTIISKIEDRKFYIGGKWMNFTRNQIDSICQKALKYNISTLEEKTKLVFTGGSRNPETHVTSIFGVIEKNGDTYLNKTLINGKVYSTFNYKPLITPWGGQLGDLSFSWVVYNGCAQPTVIQDANSLGSMGECFRRMYSSFQSQSQSITVTAGTSFSSNAQGNIIYDQSKPAQIQLVVHRHPMPDKNVEQEGYWSLTKGQRVFVIGQ